MEGNPNKPVGPLERRPWKGFRVLVWGQSEPAPHQCTS